ncbi:hypothetical protein H6F84_19840 [Microcoleus sp. FACHB-84]|nr:hypothetical protein [Microcoleus sp. FACHB-84]
MRITHHTAREKFNNNKERSIRTIQFSILFCNLNQENVRSIDFRFWILDFGF